MAGEEVKAPKFECDDGTGGNKGPLHATSNGADKRSAMER